MFIISFDHTNCNCLLCDGIGKYWLVLIQVLKDRDAIMMTDENSQNTLNAVKVRSRIRLERSESTQTRVSRT